MTPYQLLERLFPINRSITGQGVEQSLEIIKTLLPALRILKIPSGTQCFDWVVPEEWHARNAFLEDDSGERILDFKENNLHLVGYSTPIDTILPLEELQEHLYSLEELPDAIPYVTSYYKKRWGFCLSDRQRKALKPGNYHAVIDSSFKKGSLTYGELIIPGDKEQEVLLSTYICHPSLANDNLSGPVVLTFLAEWLSSLPSRKYTYRIVYTPETIGAISYLHKNLEQLKKRVIAGFIFTCLGDERTWSYLPSRNGNTLSDRVAKYVLNKFVPTYTTYSFLDRGSDERQYCSPGVDLPIASIMRSKYGTYPEYHTSLDNLGFVTDEGLNQSLELYKNVIGIIEKNATYKTTCLCEPQLGKRGLYPTISTKKTMGTTKDLMNLIAYADGSRDLLSIAEHIQVDFDICVENAERLREATLFNMCEVVNKI
ncbi:MAG TPA: DUF4910 domain-containing protein [Thermotogota bacterium]|nr:DUF4910 domain-containing protein [Thermotogota bacterium]